MKQCVVLSHLLISLHWPSQTQRTVSWGILALLLARQKLMTSLPQLQ